MPMSQSIYIFDVDGVLNDLQIYEPDERILSRMAALLQNGVFVAINTGRGYAWVEENIVRLIRDTLKNDSDALKRLFVSAEMGGIGVEFAGGIERRNPSAFSLTDGQIEQVRQLFDEHPEYADRVHWYAKDSMATLDKNRDATMEAFKPAQKELTRMLREVFKNQPVEVANSNDAIDVHSPEAGKRAGAQLIYEWLRRTADVRHDHFVCFGDSIVDYEMARFFAGQSHAATFVFSGPSFEGERDPAVRFFKTEQPYREGVYQYLLRHVKI